MIVSVHLADVGVRRVPRVLRTRLDGVPGLAYSQLATPAPLGRRVPRPYAGQVALIAGWENDDALDEFLGSHRLGSVLASGRETRMRPARVVGSWSGMPWLSDHRVDMDAAEPSAVLTLGRLKLRRTIPFARASRRAELLVLSDPACELAIGLARPPRFVATFSLWKNVAAMRDYSTGTHAPGHRDAMRAHTAKPFHHESAFVRFRPYQR